jgi:hypothetical protein
MWLNISLSVVFIHLERNRAPQRNRVVCMMSLPGPSLSLHNIVGKYATVFTTERENALEQSVARIIVSYEKVSELCAMHKRRSVNNALCS